MPLPTTSNVTRPRSLGYDVRIESNYYRLIPPLDITEESAQHPMGQQLARNPEDIVRMSEDVLNLSQVDFSGGEGLDFAHRPDNSDFDKTRFWSSLGVNVIEGHGDVQKLELEHVIGNVYNQASFTTASRQAPQMVEANGDLFVIGNAGSGDLITVIDDPGGAATATSEDPVSGSNASLLTIAEVDTDVFVSSNTDGIYKRSSATGTWSNISTFYPKRMWGLKGRLFCTDQEGDAVMEISTSGVSGARLVTLGTEGRFLTACDAGAAILAGATNGYVYAFADVDGTLTLRAQTRFQGEEITALGAGPSGIVLIGTRDGNTSRIYMGELSASYTIQNSQLLREFTITDNEHSPISHIKFTRDSAYFVFENDSGNLDLWRFDVTTTGLFRIADLNIASNGCAGIEVIEDKVFLVTDQHRVLGEQDTYQSSGYLISPLFDHFTAEDKVWSAAKLFGVDFPAQTQGKLYYSTDPDALEDTNHASWQLIKTLTNTTGVDNVETLISNAVSRWITLKLELSTSDSSVTPLLRGYSIRAYTGAGDITIPLTINCSDRLERRGRKTKVIPGLGEDIYDQLKTLEGSAVEVELLWNSESFEGTVRRVGHRAPAISSRGSQLLASQVEFVGRRQ